MPSGFYKDLPDSFFKETLFNLEVNTKGSVRDIKTKEYKEPFEKDGVLYVKVNGESPFKRKVDKESCALLDLIGHAFKTLNFPEEYFHKCSCLPIDYNERNINVNNIVWMLPDEGIESLIPGYRYIPGYTNYALSLEKIAYSFFSNRLIAKFDSHIGKIFRIDSDSGRSQRTIHEDRLLLMTFRPYPRNVDSLVINHKDGNRNNSELNNLEWITQSENLIHSYVRRESDEVPPDYVYIKSKFDPELAAKYLTQYEIHFSPTIVKWFIEKSRKDLLPTIDVNYNKAIKRFDAKNRKVEVFQSLNDAQMATFDDNGNRIRKSLILYSINSIISKNNPIRGFILNRFLFRKEEDPVPDFSDKELSKLRKKEKRRVVMYDNLKHQTTFFESVFQLQRETGFTVRVALSRLKKNIQRLPGSHLYIQYEENIGPWKLESKD